MIKIISNETQLNNLKYEEAKKFVGGDIQLIKLPNGQRMLVDEEAKVKTPRPTINKEASDILNKSGKYPLMYDVFGNAIIIDKNVKGGW